jgi:hypothetical protein
MVAADWAGAASRPASLPDSLVAAMDGRIETLCRLYGVTTLEVFGSAADARFDPQRSDFDFIADTAHQRTETLPDGALIPSPAPVLRNSLPSAR